MLVRVAATETDHTEAILALATECAVVARIVEAEDGDKMIALEGALPADRLRQFDSIIVITDHKPYLLASRACRERSVVEVGGVRFGGNRAVMIAGPCVIENRHQMVRAAMAAKAAGAEMLRGGAYKPRTSPYAFQGLGEEGLQILAHARDVSGLPVVTEVLDAEQVELVARYADMLQIGARNMANTSLLKRVGRTSKPVLLKRGFSATVEEWLMSAEYLLAAGNPNVVLCERGIRTFDPAMRFNLDLNAVALVKELSHLPVIVDPSHGTGKRSLVRPMALAGIAAGADGLIIESQPEPESAACDAFQTIDTSDLAEIVQTAQSLFQMLHVPVRAETRFVTA